VVCSILKKFAFLVWTFFVIPLRCYSFKCIYLLKYVTNIELTQSVHWLDYGLDDWGSIAGRASDLFLYVTASRSALESTQSRIQWVPAILSRGVKRPGRESDHSHPSSAEVKNARSYNSTHPYVLMAWCLIKHRMYLHGTRTTLPLPMWKLLVCILVAFVSNNLRLLYMDGRTVHYKVFYVRMSLVSVVHCFACSTCMTFWGMLITVNVWLS